MKNAFREVLRSISIGKLKTYQLYERVKARLHVQKLNTEALRKVAPRSWQRVTEQDEEFSTEIAQAILVSHLDMIVAVLGFLEIPNEEGFFAKDLDASKYLTEGWQAGCTSIRSSVSGGPAAVLHQPSGGGSATCGGIVHAR